MEQLNIFSYLYDAFKFEDKKIKVFEAFHGYGSQKMALERVGFEVEVIGTSDWWTIAVVVYNAMHMAKKEVFLDIEHEQLVEKLLSYGLSNDDKKPLTKSQINKMSTDKIKKLLKILIENKSYGAIGTFDRFPKDIDICTWSFPCQDISLAGNQKGMVEGTKSNYGYVFLNTVENTPYHERPKILLMENVRALFSEKFKEDWREIQIRLERMGYSNYADVLNSKDYEVAQNRDRVFIVSIRGGGHYEFPRPKKLTKRLKDYLEKDVDEKYFLKKTSGKFPRRERFLSNIFKENRTSFNAITTRAGARPPDNFIIENDIETAKIIIAGSLKPNKEIQDRVRVLDINGISQALRATDYKDPVKILIEESGGVHIPEATKKGYAVAHEGDGVYINRPHQKRGVVQKQMIQTLKTSGNDVGVVVKKDEKLKIRRLTPRECLRIMDVEERYIDIMLSLVSNTQAYKLAGNSIVVNVLVEIFRKMK